MAAIGQERNSASATWMEHQILEHVKDALRVTLDWKAPEVSQPCKLSSLQFTIKSFARHLERVMSIEEDGGYLKVVADAKPNLQYRIDRLSDDHDRVRMRMHIILPELLDLNEWDTERFEEVSDELRELLAEVDRHDSEEIELLQETLLMDEGGEG